MILHSVLAAWRVVVSRGDDYFWALTAGNAFWAVEIFVSIKQLNARKQSRYRI
ncbi:hypothetical protein DPMN_067552 [Dreissena polymorpha]|uniref:Uncharacterized protein n=1 Tax=Dreissena polymorpha TaxID=45954 RepID=A0A9D3YVG4_DREPO|nr:hypothetical protein DPMN_067552 [Dreissena polymorpha]